MYDPFPMFVIIMLIPIIAYAIWFAVAYWVYKDAKKRGLNAFLWGAIVFLGGWIGVIIYFLLREQQKPCTPQRICPNCGRQIPHDAYVCPYCAKKFESYL